MTLSSRSGAPAREGRPGPDGQRLPRAARIRRAGDIRRVMRAGDRISGPLVDVISLPSRSARVGVIVPRYGNSAVARNRVRRRLKELARREWLPVARQADVRRDVILRAKPAAYGASYERLKASLNAPFGRLCER